MPGNLPAPSAEQIEQSILIVRGCKVMLDSDLANSTALRPNG